MKSLTKLLAALGTAGMLAASAPASAFLALQFSDGAGNLLYQTDETSNSFSTGTPGEIQLSATLNGWILRGTFSYTVLSPITMNITGSLYKTNQFGQTANLSAINDGESNFGAAKNSTFYLGNTAAAVTASNTLKIRLIETNFTVPSDPTGVRLDDAFAVSNNPVFKQNTVNVEIAAASNNDGILANTLFANPSSASFPAGTLCGTSTNANTACNPTATDVPANKSVVYDFTTPAHAPFVGAATMDWPFNSVGAQHSGFTLVAGFDVTYDPAFDSFPGAFQGGSANDQVSFTNTISVAARVPEPGSLALLGLALIGVAAVQRKRTA